VELYKRGNFHSEAVQGSRPMKYKGYLLPEYFYCTGYFLDNDGKKVTSENVKSFRTWSVELLIRVTSVNTEEVIRTTVYGASNYSGHTVVIAGTNPKDNHNKYQPVKASYYKSIGDNRARLMAYAITSAVQDCVYKKQKDGSHLWIPFGRNEISEEKLQELGKASYTKAYIRKDHAFYQEVARIYKDAVERNESPNNVLEQTYGKKKTTVQGWTTECRRRGLLSKAEKGKPSMSRKTTTKKGKK
jgi:hypothetical protein